MPRFVDRMKGAPQEAGIRLPEPTLSLVAQYMGQDPPEAAGHAPVPHTEEERTAKPPEVEAEAVEPADEQNPTELLADYGKVGGHVASMLEGVLERQDSTETVESAPSGEKSVAEPLHERAARKAHSRQRHPKAGKGSE